MRNHIICCDWGTSSFRVRLVDKEAVKVIDEELSTDGIAKVFERWKANESKEDLNERVFFFLSDLKKHLNILKERHAGLGNIPVVISGMASSSIGMMELPYAELPFPLSGERAVVYAIPASERFEHPVLLLSGVRDGDEVMRGEESQLMGMESHISGFRSDERTIVLLPGTHSKHVTVRQSSIIQIQTYLTGELFAIVSQHGLLKEAVQHFSRVYEDGDWEIFLQGVDYSGESPLLQSLFMIRTNQLFERLTKQQNYIYLSGLLIGYELRSLTGKEFDRLVLCSGPGLFEHYKRALTHLGLDKYTLFLTPQQAENTTIKGQVSIVNRHFRD